MLPQILPAYAELLATLAAQGAEWVQIDEPILVTELVGRLAEGVPGPPTPRSARDKHAAAGHLLRPAHRQPARSSPSCRCRACILDAINARGEVEALIARLPKDRVVSLGVINGRNIWKTDLNGVLRLARAAAPSELGDRSWIAPSCSLAARAGRSRPRGQARRRGEVRGWPSRCRSSTSCRCWRRALNGGRDNGEGRAGRQPGRCRSRRTSPRTQQPRGQGSAAQQARRWRWATASSPMRCARPSRRRTLKLPAYPTTTIGSVPADRARSVTRAASSRRGKLDAAGYKKAMQARDRRGRCASRRARARRAGARRSRAQRHGRVFRRAARWLRLQPASAGCSPMARAA